MRRRQARPGPGKSRIERRCLLEHTDGAPDIVFAAALPEITAPEIKLVGFQVFGGLLNMRHRLLLTGPESNLQCLHDVSGYFILDRENVFQFAVISRRPQMTVGANID